MQRQKGATDKPMEDLPQVITGLCVQQKSLRTWIQMALAYYSRSNSENFVHVLEEAIGGCLRTYASYKDDLARANVLLAAHFTRQAHKELGSRQTALQAKVTNILKLLDAMKRPEDRSLLVVRGYALMLTAGRAQEADAHFVAVLRNVPTHIPALIGRACLAYNRQDYIGALGYFKSVLMHQPRGPADVRVGIAHCFLKLGNLDSARRSFELALQHNGRCQNALVGMAILKLNQGEKAAAREGINLLCAAYEQNFRHPMVLHILAFHYFYAKIYTLADALAGNSYMWTDIPLLQSQNCFYVARCFHARQDFEHAMEFYMMAMRHAPEGYVLPQFGLAQMYLRRGDQGRAKVCLEAMLKVMPKQLDVMRLLAKIYMAEKNIDAAIKLLLKVVESRSSSSLQDYDSWVSLALAYEQKQRWKHAIEAYQRAMRIYGGRGESYPIEWLNNVAVIQKLAKMPQQALESINTALAANGMKGGEHKETNMLTLRFNRGRILEDLLRCDLAAIAYRDILADYPNYCDCYLRLGVMALRQNDVLTAIDFFKDVLKYDNDSLAARTSLANIYVKLGLTTQAMLCLNVVLKRDDRQDTYSLVLMGNAVLKSLQSCLASGNDVGAKKKQNRALGLFSRSLGRDSRNLWAANGVGVALSCRNRKSAGEAIFKQVAEAGKGGPPSARLNLAHMALELGKYQEAIDAYMLCLQQNSQLNNSVEVMLGLAKALYLEGNAAESKLWLSKARHLAPHDPVVMNNLGLAIYEDAQQLLEGQRAKSVDLIKAELELHVAYGLFDYLSTCLSQTEVPLQSAAENADKCQILLTKLPVELQRVRELEALHLERIRLEEELRKEVEEQQEQERLQREQEMAKRQEVLNRTKKLLKEPRELAPQKKPSKQRGRRNGEDSDVDEGERAAKKRKRSEEKAKKRQLKEEAMKKKAEAKYKSKEFVDSNESESEASEDDGRRKKRRKHRSSDDSDSNVVYRKSTKSSKRKAIYTPSEDSGSDAMEEEPVSSPDHQQMDAEAEAEPENLDYPDEDDGMSPEKTIQYMKELQRRLQE